MNGAFCVSPTANWKDKLKQDLREEAKLSSTTMPRLNNGDNATTDVLLRICQVLNCQIGDIIKIIPKEEA
ncbi:MAG: helix-turn-helix transcriptional regulator [Actinomyces sp.]|nr:helix-turn-helix transcriptional regulator [Actinomyces sp.]